MARIQRKKARGKSNSPRLHRKIKAIVLGTSPQVVGKKFCDMVKKDHIEVKVSASVRDEEVFPKYLNLDMVYKNIKFPMCSITEGEQEDLVKEFQNVKPDVVVLHYGAELLVQSNKPEDCAYQVFRIARWMHRNFRIPQMTLLSCIKSDDAYREMRIPADELSSRMMRFNAFLKETCKNSEGISFYNLRGFMNDTDGMPLSPGVFPKYTAKYGPDSDNHPKYQQELRNALYISAGHLAATEAACSKRREQ